MTRELTKRIAEPFLSRNDFWWMGFVMPGANNWMPWCYSNMFHILCTLPLPEEQKLAALRKAAHGGDTFIGAYADDGACDEGSAYWNAAAGTMFDLLEAMLAVSGGEINIFGQPKIRNMFRYITGVHVGGGVYASFGDCPNRPLISPHILHRYGAITGDRTMDGHAAFLARERRAKLAERNADGLNVGCLNRWLRNLLAMNEWRDSVRAEEAPPDIYWTPSLQVLVARPELGSGAGMTLITKGGSNAESHNHNDVGSFMLYAGGEPVVIDPGVGTYTAKTFSDKRYDIWTMQSRYHNLPTVNGCLQRAGKYTETAAYDVDFSAEDGKVFVGLAIDRAYPKEAGIRVWRREFLFAREGAGKLTLTDRYEFEQEGGAVSFHFMCCLPPETQEGKAVFRSDSAGRVQMVFDGALLESAVEEIPLEDAAIASNWKRDTLYRLTLSSLRPLGKQGVFTFVFSYDGGAE
jgi:hypothetical protein